MCPIFKLSQGPRLALGALGPTHFRLVPAHLVRRRTELPAYKF